MKQCKLVIGSVLLVVMSIVIGLYLNAVMEQWSIGK
jgi:hypothetical protein